MGISEQDHMTGGRWKLNSHVSDPPRQLRDLAVGIMTKLTVGSLRLHLLASNSVDNRLLISTS